MSGFPQWDAFSPKHRSTGFLGFVPDFPEHRDVDDAFRANGEARHFVCYTRRMWNPNPKLTEWKECGACGATVRHDDGVCIRDRRHPNYAPSLGTGLRPDLPHSQPHPRRV